MSGIGHNSGGFRVLALDQATNTGWACGEAGSFSARKVDSGVYRMPKRPTMGERLVFFRRELIARIDHFEPDVLAYERPYWPHPGAPKGSVPVAFAVSIVNKVADGFSRGQAVGLLNKAGKVDEDEEGGPPPVSAEVLIFLQKVAGMVEEIAAEKGLTIECYTSQSWRKSFLGVSRTPREIVGKERNGYMKKLAVQKCRALGYDVASEDEAEAIGILYHALEGAAAAERAQGDLLELAGERLGR